MRPALVRLAILAYPGRWRERYGTELRDMTADVLADQQAALGELRVLLGLVVHGFDERLRVTESPGVRATLTTTSAILAGLVIATAVASDSLIVPNVALSLSVRLAPGVVLEHGGKGRQQQPGRIRVTVPKGPNPLISVSARSAVTIDPRSGQVLSVSRASGRPSGSRH